MFKHGSFRTILDHYNLKQNNIHVIYKCFADKKHMWIGFHCLKDNFVFEWESGASVKYTNWARREPNGYQSNEDCVHAYWDVRTIIIVIFCLQIIIVTKIVLDHRNRYMSS